MPAIALSQTILKSNQEMKVFFAGRPRSTEEKLASNAGLTFVSIHSASFKKGILKKISFFILVIYGFFQSLFFILKLKPDYIVGFGGYTSFPLLFAGIILKKNVTVHESNAIPGKAVTLLVKAGAKFAYGVVSENKKMLDLILKTKKKDKACFTGNPVRKSIINADKNKGYELSGFSKEKPIILVIGGSQGSKTMNTKVAESICSLKNTISDLQVIHIAGKNNEENVREIYTTAKINNYVIDYTDQIGALYKIADIAVARAGALTIAELSTVGLPALLIPFPYATDGHQSENAMNMERAGAAKIIFENELNVDLVAKTLSEVINDENVRKKMSNAAVSLAVKDADKLLYDFVIKNG